jgi:hypothetical protein
VILVEQRILQGLRLLGPLPAGEEALPALLPEIGVGARGDKKASVVTHCLLDAIETLGFPEDSVIEALERRREVGMCGIRRAAC